MTSLFRFTRSAFEGAPPADCIESSRIRWRIAVVSCNAPSAVDTKEIASLAFLTAWLSPDTWDSIRAAIAKPAASSTALFIRLPVARRSIADAISPCDCSVALWAFNADTFVFTVSAMSLCSSFADHGPCRVG